MAPVWNHRLYWGNPEHNLELILNYCWAIVGPAHLWPFRGNVWTMFVLIFAIYWSHLRPLFGTIAGMFGAILDICWN